MKKNKCSLLAHAIKKTLALGASGFLVFSSNAWAGDGINPNEVWVNLAPAHKICTFDFDQDGDLDIIHYYDKAVSLQENIGSLVAPLFAPKKIIASASHAIQVAALNNPSQSCALQYQSRAHVDIDNDGDLDLFIGKSLYSGRGSILYPLRFMENTKTGLQLSESVFGLSSALAYALAFVDVDGDGDSDLFGRSWPGGLRALYYENIGTPENAAFVQQDDSPLACNGESILTVDLNGDNKVDRVCEGNFAILSSPEGYVKASNIFQDISFSDGFIPYRGYTRTSLDVNQDGINEVSLVFNSDSAVTQIKSVDREISLYKIYSFEMRYAALAQCGLEKESFSAWRFHDVNGDNQEDLFARSNEGTGNRIIYCKNKGTTDSPLFSFVGEVLGLSTIGYGGVLGDMDGDGDIDVYADKFYDNIGTRETPMFKHISHTIGSWKWVNLDFGGDSQDDSILLSDLHSTRFINKMREPVIGITTAAYSSDEFIVATNRLSQVQLYRCSLDKGCRSPVILPQSAKEISVSVGDFTHNNESNEIALATVDKDGLIHLNIYDKNLILISYGQGGSAHSITMSSGQLDSDPEDEIALSFVQGDGTVLAAAVNFNMSIVGTTQQGQGKNPSIVVGNFSNIQGSYALSYITADDQLKTGTFQGNGTLINQGVRGAATDAKISKAVFLSETLTDEYVVSTLQSNGVAGLVGFSSNGEVLGKLTGGVAQQPTVISRYSATAENLGLAISVIQEDKKPAVIFLDNQGNYLATGVGGKEAVIATLVDGGNGQTTLVYVDENGLPRWETFGVDGVKK